MGFNSAFKGVTKVYLLTTTIVAPPSNASKWQMGFNWAFKGLIERHVSANSEAIIRFNNFQLYETNKFHGIKGLEVAISSSMFVWQYTEGNYEVCNCEVSGNVCAGGVDTNYSVGSSP